MNRLHAFTQLVLARLREFFREPIAIFWVYGFPLLLAAVLGWAFMNTVTPPFTIDVAPPVGRDAVTLDVVLKDEGFDVQDFSGDEARKRLQLNKTSLVIADFADRTELTFDPMRPDSVQAKGWIKSILTRTNGYGAERLREVEVTAPGSRYIDFLLPGLIGLNIMGGGLFGVGFVLVEMRVRKLFKRLMATPVHRGDFLVAMLSSRFLFLIPEMASLLGLACWVAGVPVLGSWGTLIVVVLLGTIAFSAIGLLLGCRAEKTETISGLVNLIMLPQYLISGVFFSATKFPEAVQPLIQALPLTRLINALREVMLEGAGLWDIRWHLLVLAAWGIATFAVALRWFKWT